METEFDAENSAKTHENRSEPTEKPNSGAPLDPSKLKPALEAILFAAGYPVGFDKLSAALGLEKDEVKSLANSMKEEFDGRGITLLVFDDACQLCTKEEYIDLIRDVLGVRRGGNLSKSSMETLAIVAYHQPVTRSYIEQVRGMDSSYAVNNLSDKKLIEVCGRLDAPGHPSLYRTTDDFLRVFGLNSLAELPPVELFGIVDTDAGK